MSTDLQLSRSWFKSSNIVFAAYTDLVDDIKSVYQSGFKKLNWAPDVIPTLKLRDRY